MKNMTKLHFNKSDNVLETILAILMGRDHRTSVTENVLRSAYYISLLTDTRASLIVEMSEDDKAYLESLGTPEFFFETDSRMNAVHPITVKFTSLDGSQAVVEQPDNGGSVSEAYAFLDRFFEQFKATVANRIINTVDSTPLRNFSITYRPRDIVRLLRQDKQTECFGVVRHVFSEPQIAPDGSFFDMLLSVPDQASLIQVHSMQVLPFGSPLKSNTFEVDAMPTLSNQNSANEFRRLLNKTITSLPPGARRVSIPGSKQ